MIVPMKKVSVVVTDKTRDASLGKLRDLGVVHLAEKQNLVSENLSNLLDRKAKVETVRGLLGSYQTDKQSGSPKAMPKQDQDLVTQTLSLVDERKTIQEQLGTYRKERNRIEKWGDFSPASLKALEAHGVILIPYHLSIKAYEAIGKDRQFVVLSQDKTTVYGLAVGAEIAGEIPFLLPECSISEIDKLVSTMTARLAEIETQLKTLAAQAGQLEAELNTLMQNIEFETAKICMETSPETPAEFAISWIVGYVPQDDVGALKRAAAENGWALLVDDPRETDDPPTLLKNNTFLRSIKPLFDLLGTTPGYREFDISMSYLLFLSFFVAMILGDAGYGVVVLIIALLIGIKAKAAGKPIPDVARLLGIFSLTTITLGVLTGSFFAIQSDHPFFQPKIPFLGQEDNIKWICFSVGAGQIILAHLKKAKKALPTLSAVAQLGWISLVVGLYFLVLNMVVSRENFPVPPFATTLIGGGIGVYFIFIEQKGGNFLKNILKSLANALPTLLNAISNLADIISYIRLFAVGLAGAAIAGTFNEMGGGPISGGSIGIVIGSLILIFGHGLNLVMSTLSVIVHGVRLNLLEYGGHLGMEWSGHVYSPFALKSKKQG